MLYRALVGLNFPPHGDKSQPEKRLCPEGQCDCPDGPHPFESDDIQPKSIPWLLEQGLIVVSEGDPA